MRIINGHLYYNFGLSGASSLRAFLFVDPNEIQEKMSPEECRLWIGTPIVSIKEWEIQSRQGKDPDFVESFWAFCRDPETREILLDSRNLLVELRSFFQYRILNPTEFHLQWVRHGDPLGLGQNLIIAVEPYSSKATTQGVD